MKAVLLDTSVASSLFDKRRKDHELIKERLFQKISKEALLYVCPIVLGEIEYGFKVDLNGEDPRRQAIIKELGKIPVQNIDKHIADCYSEVRAELFRKFAPKQERNARRKCVKKGMYVEDLIDSTSGRKLAIQENDLWIIACALAKNMTFVTTDKMKRLRQIVEEEMKLIVDWCLIEKSP